MVKVGIPRALSYYRYYPFWKTLLEEYGAEVVVSTRTGKRSLEHGVRHCVDDICLPVKVYFGHILELKDKVDRLFISRMVSVEKGESDTYTCPKLIGLPDMIRSSLEDLPPIIDFVVDVQNRSLASSARQLGTAFSASPARVRKGLRAATRIQNQYDRELLKGITPDEALAVVLPNGNPSKVRSRPGTDLPLNIALVGHEYLIHDPFISHDLPRKLWKQGANVIFSSQVPPDVIEREVARYPGISWSYEKEILGATSYFLKRRDIHGVIMAVCFACGPDSIISEIIMREVRQDTDPPLMSLVLDEHTGEAGVATRVEAFIDLIKRSRERR